MACVHGDIFCRECALNNILAQKKEIKRLEKTRENEEKDAAEDKARQDEEAQARAVKDFELVQAGFDVKETGERKAGEKRKAPLDEDEAQGQDDRAKARKSNEDGKVGALGHVSLFSLNVLIRVDSLRKMFSLHFGYHLWFQRPIRRTSCTRSRKRQKLPQFVRHRKRDNLIRTRSTRL